MLDACAKVHAPPPVLNYYTNLDDIAKKAEATGAGCSLPAPCWSGAVSKWVNVQVSK